MQLLVSTYFTTVYSVKFVFNWNLNILDLFFIFRCHDNRFLVVIATKKMKNVVCNLIEDNDIKIKDF